MRIFISGLDTVGVILIGLLLTRSSDQLITNSESNSSNFLSVITFANSFSLIQIAFLALLLFISKSLLSGFFIKVMNNVLADAESDATTKTFRKLLNGGYKNFSEISSQDLIFSLNYSAASGISNLISLTVSIISEATLLITIGLLFLFVDYQIALFIILYFATIGYFIYKLFGPKMHSIGKKYAESARWSSASLNDSVFAYRELFTLHKQDEFVTKFSKGRTSFAKSNANSAFYASLPRYIVETALLFGAVMLAAYAFRGNDPTRAIGILGIFLTGSMRLMASLLPLQTSLNSLKQTIAQSDPFFNLVKKTLITQDLPAEHKYQLNENSEPFSIKFENVTFNYPNSEFSAIRNVSFEIAAGEYIALIGPSGSGKSTIADLIIKLIEPTEGSVSYPDTNPDYVKIGYVPQSPGIVSGTILENITLNIDSGSFDEKKLSKALKDSHLSDLVHSLRNGINSDLGAQLDALSGGQMQRIGLARALYSDPGLLVLDEATSALDAETESAITDSLNKLKGSCTIVVIAHRLSTVQNADRVYVIENGRIAASGKFSELAKTNELVARYVELSKLNVD